VAYRRTAVIKLDTLEGANKHLRETVEQFKYCANTASEWCWYGDDGYHVTSKVKAEDALYDQLREDTELTANLVQRGIRQAVEAVKSGVERLKNNQDTSYPTFIIVRAVWYALHDEPDHNGRRRATVPHSPAGLMLTKPAQRGEFG
jgi:hypothetical protein